MADMANQAHGLWGRTYTAYMCRYCCRWCSALAVQPSRPATIEHDNLLTRCAQNGHNNSNNNFFSSFNNVDLLHSMFADCCMHFCFVGGEKNEEIFKLKWEGHHTSQRFCGKRWMFQPISKQPIQAKHTRHHPSPHLFLPSLFCCSASINNVNTKND